MYRAVHRGKSWGRFQNWYMQTPSPFTALRINHSDYLYICGCCGYSFSDGHSHQSCRGALFPHRTYPGTVCLCRAELAPRVPVRQPGKVLISVTCGPLCCGTGRKVGGSCPQSCAFRSSWIRGVSSLVRLHRHRFVGNLRRQVPRNLLRHTDISFSDGTDARTIIGAHSGSRFCH